MSFAIRRSVSWVSVDGFWSRMSVMSVSDDERLSDDVSIGTGGEESDRRTARTTILMIPGNPGNEGFYEHFGGELLNVLYTKSNHNEAERSFDFVTISHLNHVNLPEELRNNGMHKHHERFSLDEQVEHKLNFCREHIPKGSQVVLLGHSIGSYMMLRILPSLLSEGYDVICAGSLFPTIEKMAVSPNGRKLFPILSALHTADVLLRVLLFWVDYLPSGVKKWLCGWNLPSNGVPDCVYSSAAELFHLNVVRNIVHMSVDELSTVRNLDTSLLKHSNVLRFYYGMTDGWCPLDYGEAMRTRLGTEIVAIDEEKCSHAFVIRDGEVVARKVAEWID